MIKRRAMIEAGLAAAATSLARPAGAQPRSDARASGPSRSGRAGPRIGLALGSGSVHGLAHVGVLRVLEREGFRPDLLAGTSAGAIVGALYAAGLDAATIESEASDLEWQQSGRLTWPGRGLMSNAPLQRRIDAAVGRRRIESFPMPFGAVATSLLEGDRVLLRSGRTGQVVGASSSVPVLFDPVRVDGRELVDGALTEPVPVDSVRAMGADFVIAIDVAYRPHDEKPQGLTDIAFQMMHIMVNALIDEQIRRADFVLRLDVHRLMLGAWNAQMLIDEGERAMHEGWPELSRRLREAGYAPATSAPGTSRPPR